MLGKDGARTGIRTGTTEVVEAAAGGGNEMPDHIIIGAGSGGAVLTNRLSADPSVEAAVIEAGDWD